MTILESSPLLDLVSNSYLPFHNLPSFYNSFYPRSLVIGFREAQARIEGNVRPGSIFPSNAFAPDVFSSYAALALTKYFGFISIPLSLSGISARSSGMASLQKNKGDEFIRYMSDFSTEDQKRIYSGPFGAYDVLDAQICNDACKVLLSFGQLEDLSIPMPHVEMIANALINNYTNQHYLTQPWSVFEMLKIAHDFRCNEGFAKLMEIATWYLQSYSDQLALWLDNQTDPPKIGRPGPNYLVANCKYFDVNTAAQAAKLYQLILDDQM